ncbi:MAG: transketolase [Pseudomonadota bacterium]
MSKSAPDQGSSKVSREALANAIRALSMDAVQQANSGHPGAPMGMANMAEVLWRDFLHHNPTNPNWFNRDRFVLSNGHGSMLLYSLLHLTGYDVSIEDLKNFRQMGSKTPGHPEYRETPGVETTTGPLGQGLANAVGMALAEKHLAAKFNRAEHELVDHYTYVFLGDGCLMEGISHEACSLAGTLKLGKLIALYDNNGISIDGKVEGWFTDDTKARFASYGWHVIGPIDGHDPQQLAEAISASQTETSKPSLVICRTVIGHGAPTKAGTADSHGAPLGDDEIAATRAALQWESKPFEIPTGIYEAWNQIEAGKQREAQWETMRTAYHEAFPELGSEFERSIAGELPADWAQQSATAISERQKSATKEATRKSSQSALETFATMTNDLVGGSADLTGSNNTKIATSVPLSDAHAAGNYIYYGVREFAMSAIMNGMAVHGGVIPYGGTFLVFSDYARNAVRMASLMGLGSIFVYTHDSVGLGEDGPTHQPIEHAASLRLIPNLDVWRPCDATETFVAWQQAIEHRGNPSCLLLTRQGVEQQPRDTRQLEAIKRGAYVLIDGGETPQAIVIATGSEIGLARQAVEAVSASGAQVRLVSMPCVEAFERQDDGYKGSVLPARITRRLVIEAGSSQCWYRYSGIDGAVIGIDEFGASAPADQVFNKLGFSVENCTRVLNDLIAN